MISAKKILFVNPRNPLLASNPMAILDMAPYLRQRGFAVDVCRFPPSRIKKYDVIAFSCISSYADTVFTQIDACKRIYPHAHVVVGGKWTNSMSDEEQRRLLALNATIAEGAGECFFTGDDAVDYEAYPAWDKTDFDILFEKEEVMSARGCPFHCHFCHNTEKKIQYFPASRTIKNIGLTLSKSRTVFFVDDVFVTNFDHAKAIYDGCKKARIAIEGRSRFFVHVNLVNDKTIDLLKMFKPYMVQIGLESGSQMMLDKMNKKTTLSNIREVVPILARHTPVAALWLIGYPFETLQSLDETESLMRELKPYIKQNWVSCYVPVPNTVGYAAALETGGMFLPLSNRPNARPSFVPSGLSEDILARYRDRMMALNDD